MVDKNDIIHSQVARLDERTEMILESVTKIQNTVERNYDGLMTTMDKNYTKKTEFEPIKKIVYGFVAFLLLSIGGMFVTVAVKSGQADTTSISRPIK